MRKNVKNGATPNTVGLRYVLIGILIGSAYAALAYCIYLYGIPIKFYAISSYTSAWVAQAVLALVFGFGAGAIQFRERRAKPAVVILGVLFLFAGFIFIILYVRAIGAVVNGVNRLELGGGDRWVALKSNLIPFTQEHWAAVPGMLTLLLESWICQRYARWRFLLDTDSTSGVYGESRIASRDELKEKNLLGEKRPSPVGRERETGEIISFDFTERIIVAPTQTGKDRGVIIPALLMEDRGTVLYDPKAEAWAVTAMARSKRNNGREIITLDPFCILQDEDYLSDGRDELCKKAYRFDPLTFMSEIPAVRERQINGLVSALVLRASPGEGGASKDSHFDDYAEIFFRGYLHYAFKRWEVNGKPPAERPRLTDLLAAAEIDENEFRELLEKMKLAGGRATGSANRILSTGSDEWGSILSTIYRQVEWMADMNMRDMLQDSNFDPNLVFENLADVYIILPEDQMKTHNRFVRLVFQTFISLLQQLPPSMKPQKTVWLLVNEAHLLGYFPAIESAWNIIGGRGGRFWMVFQNLAQSKVYPQHQVFQAAAVKHIFGTDDQDTLKWAIYMGGKSTELTESFSAGGGHSSTGNDRNPGTASTNRGVSIREVSADVLTVDTLRTMPADEQLVFMRGVNPVRCLRMPYDQDKRFVGQWLVNPLIKYQSA